MIALAFWWFAWLIGLPGLLALGFWATLVTARRKTWVGFWAVFWTAHTAYEVWIEVTCTNSSDCNIRLELFWIPILGLISLITTYGRETRARDADHARLRAPNA